MTRRPKYASVNGQWPDVVPALSGQEAISAAKRLWRLAMGKPCPYQVVLATGERAGRYPMRRSYAAVTRLVRPGHMVLVVSERRGWRGLVHSLSHRCHARLHPGKPDHDDLGRHAFVERTMIAHVVASGWLDGRLRRPEPAPRRQATADERDAAAIGRWERKLARAQRALAKLRRRQKRRHRQPAPKIGVDGSPAACA